jgi:tetratricopeptide (TPR) repeat protein
MLELITTAAPALAEAIRTKRLLVFAGSGISKAPPACLPDWAGFNASLLGAIKTSALSIPGFSPDTREVIQTLTLEPSRALAFSELVVKELAGDSYFPVLQVLDSLEPNNNHAALPALARAGILRAVVTTNFDTLIEAAFREADVPLETYVVADDRWRAHAEDVCVLFKIHGSVTNTTTLRDTVSQKIRGLPLYVRARLAGLYRENHVLVVGFSGADLEFGKDYLAFSAIESSGPGITWMLRPQTDSLPSGSTTEALTHLIVPCPVSKLPKPAQDIVLCAGTRGAVIEADFFSVCELLNARGASKAVPEPERAQTAAYQRARAWVAKWFESLGTNPLQCVLFCSQFLRSAGRQMDADAVNANLAPFLEAIREQEPLSAANLALVLADNAKEQGHADRVERLSKFALETTDSINVHERSFGSEEPLWTNVRAAAWSNLGYCHLIRADRVSADHALEQARFFAATLDDPTMLGTIYLNQAQLADGSDQLECRLELIRQAGALQLRGQFPQNAYATFQFEALTLVRLAEYDPALAALEEARHLVKLAYEPLRGRLSIETPDADIKRRRGQTNQAYRQLKDFLRELDRHPLLAAQARINMIKAFDFFSSLRPALVAEVDWILEHMANGSVPSDGSVPHFPSESQLRAWRNRLQTNAIPSEPAFLQFVGPPHDSEDALRRRITVLEFSQELRQLPECFEAIGRLKYDARHPWRLLDSAVALVAACERTGDHALRLEGLHRKSIASQILGDIWTSIEALEGILRAQPPAPPTLQAVVDRDLGTSFSRIGKRRETERQFRAAVALHEELAEFDEAAVDVLDFADALARFEDFDAALSELNGAADVIGRTSRPEFNQKWSFARSLFERLRTRPDVDLLELPAELIPKAEHPLAIETIETERRFVESAKELRMLALNACRSDHHELAAAFALEAQKEFARGGDQLEVAQCLHDLGEIAQAQRHWSYAREQSQRALELRMRLGDITGRIESGAACALSRFQLGEYPEAGDTAQSVLLLAQRRNPSRWILIAWCVLVAVLEEIGSTEQYEAVLRRFLADFPPDDRRLGLAAVRNRFQSKLASRLRPGHRF